MNTNLDAELERLRAAVKQLELADTGRIRTTRRRVRALRLGLGLVLAIVPAVAVAVDLPYAFQAGDPVVAQELNENFDALAAAIDALVIREDTTIQIGPMETCSAIQQALDDLDGRTIAGTATVTIELLPGTYACETSIVVRHRDGNRIHVRGAGNTAGDVTLTFPPNTTGVYVGESRALGLLENLTLQGDLHEGGDGLSVRYGSTARVANIVVTGFNWGISAGLASSITGTGVLATGNNLGVGAYRTSVIELVDSEAIDNNDSGFLAISGGTMHMSGCNAEGNGNHGFVGYIDGLIEVYGSAAIGNGFSGFRFDQHSTAFTGSTTASGNLGYGYEAIMGSYLMRAYPQPSVGNVLGESNMAINAPNPGNGAVIAQ